MGLGAPRDMQRLWASFSQLEQAFIINKMKNCTLGRHMSQPHKHMERRVGLWQIR